MEREKSHRRNKMKRLIPGLPILAFALIFIGCPNPIVGTNTGSLTINVGDAVSRTLIPAISMEPTSYDISGTGPGGATFAQTITGSSSLTIDKLAFGDWTVSVTARNAKGTAIGAGANTTTVHSNATSTVNVTVKPYDGFGTLNLQLGWTASQVQTAQVESSLLPFSGPARVLDFAVDSAAGTANFSASDVATGYHTLTLKLKDNGYLTMGAVDIVRIVKDQATSGSYVFSNINQATGTLQVNVTPEMADPLLVSISGASATKPADQSMSLGGSVSNYSDNVAYVWYVNGDAVGTGASYSFGTTWAQGHYRIDLTAFSADGKRAGSASANVQVTAGETNPSSPSGYFTYTVTAGMVTITGLSSLWVSSADPNKNMLSIPSVIEGNPVTKISTYAFLNRNTIVQLTIPSSVITIDSGAFYGCSALTTLNIQNGVQQIKDWSFFLCTSLVSVFIPASVTEVGAYSFVLCRQLESITVDSNSPFLTSTDGVLFTKDKTRILQYPMRKQGLSYAIPGEVQVIGDAAFYAPYSLSQISIPYGVKEIGMQAFASNSNLTTISIPNSVTAIDFKAFEYCYLTDLVIPDSVLQIGDYAFISDFYLASVTLSSAIPPTLGMHVFDSNASNEQIHVPPGSLAAYQNAPNWVNYSSRIVAP
jgi:hypothetical protein